LKSLTWWLVILIEVLVVFLQKPDFFKLGHNHFLRTYLQYMYQFIPKTWRRMN
jgi:branched-subunit amino acid transport protein